MARWLFILALAGPLVAQSEQTLLEPATGAPSADVTPGATDVVALAFKLSRATAAEDAGFLTLRVRNTGSAAECLRVRLWLDSDGNGVFDPLSDVQLAQAGGAFPVSLGAFTETQSVPNGQVRGFFVTLDVSPNAAAGATFELQVQAADVTMSAHGVAGSAASGNTFTVVGAGQARLAVISQPAGAWADQPFTNQPALEVLDATGQRVSSDNTTVVTAALAPGTGAAGATLGPTSALTATASNGVVTFSGLKIGTAGTGYALHFTAANFAGALTGSFDVGAVTLSLHVAQQPAGAKAGKPFETQPVIEFRNAGGAVASVNYTVTATLASGPGSLSGNAQTTASNGVATFSNLAVDKPGTYQLAFTAPGASGTQSQQFSVASTSRNETSESSAGWLGCACSSSGGGLTVLFGVMIALGFVGRKHKCA